MVKNRGHLDEVRYDLCFWLCRSTNSGKAQSKGIKIVMVSYGNAYQTFNEAMAVNPDRMTFNFEDTNWPTLYGLAPTLKEAFPDES